MSSLGPQIFWSGSSKKFLQDFVTMVYPLPCDKVWSSSYIWSTCARPGNEEKCRIFRGWVKTPVQFLAVCEAKIMLFWDNVGDRLQFATHLPDCLYHVSLKRFRPLKATLSCKIIAKRWFLGTRFVGEGIPQTLDMRFQIALTSNHVVNFGQVHFSELRD